MARPALSDLLAKYQEDAESPAPTPPPSLDSLVGTVLYDHHGDPYGMRDPGPIRPRPKAPSTTRRYVHDVLPFTLGDGYTGEWWLGWQQPWWKLAPKKRVLRRTPWLPRLSWSLRRSIPGSRFTECHHEWHDEIEMRATKGGCKHARRLLAKLNEVLDPALALNNPRHLYLVTAGLVATFEDYLAAYFQRPETIKHIENMAKND